MELLAIVALAFLTVLGWGLAQLLPSQWINREEQIYFAPALGLGVTATIAYVAAALDQLWLIGLIGALAIAVALIHLLRRYRGGANVLPEAWPLLRFTLVAFGCLWAMQLCLHAVYARVYPGPDQIWAVYHMTGVTPPDQLFAWHQAMFADQDRQYGRDSFLDDMDLYDRPHLGGYTTLFFFRLFGLPLTETNWVYPAAALRFYHCFWWLLNNLYLFGIAPLFLRLFGRRAAILALAATAVSGFVFMSNVGGWPKFVAVYPFLLAALLFVERRSTALQAILCAGSFYLHGSILPFLLGFGFLQILCLWFPILPGRKHVRDVLVFAAVCAVLIGSWFGTVRLVGSKQPLYYYYIYDAGLTASQTRPVTELAREFHARHTWKSLALFSVRGPVGNLVPLHEPGAVFSEITFPALFSGYSLPSLGSASHYLQRFHLPSASGVLALPAVCLGFVLLLRQAHAGKIVLAIYLLPALLMALLYRKPWVFSLHIMVPFHAMALALFVLWAHRLKPLWAWLWLVLLALEGIVCLVWADLRFNPLRGLSLHQLPPLTVPALLGYFSVVVLLLRQTKREIWAAPGRLTESEPVTRIFAGWTARDWFCLAAKIATGVLISAAVFGAYALYCLRLYRA